jgi:hypothetical protein
VEEILKVCWGEAAEGEDRESPTQAIVGLSIEALIEVLSLMKLGSKDEVLASISQQFSDTD